MCVWGRKCCACFSPVSWQTPPHLHPLLFPFSLCEERRAEHTQDWHTKDCCSHWVVACCWTRSFGTPFFSPLIHSFVIGKQQQTVRKKQFAAQRISEVTAHWEPCDLLFPTSSRTCYTNQSKLKRQGRCWFASFECLMKSVEVRCWHKKFTLFPPNFPDSSFSYYVSCSPVPHVTTSLAPELVSFRITQFSGWNSKNASTATDCFCFTVSFSLFPDARNCSRHRHCFVEDFICANQISCSG